MQRLHALASVEGVGSLTNNPMSCGIDPASMRSRNKHNPMDDDSHLGENNSNHRAVLENKQPPFATRQACLTSPLGYHVFLFHISELSG